MNCFRCCNNQDNLCHLSSNTLQLLLERVNDGLSSCWYVDIPQLFNICHRHFHAGNKLRATNITEHIQGVHILSQYRRILCFSAQWANNEFN